MANIVCPNCNRIVDDSAKSCPGCKFNIKKYVKEMKKKGGNINTSISLGSVYSHSEPAAVPELDFLKKKPVEPQISPAESQIPAQPAAPSYASAQPYGTIPSQPETPVISSFAPQPAPAPEYTRPMLKPRVAPAAPAYDPNYHKDTQTVQPVTQTTSAEYGSAPAQASFAQSQEIVSIGSTPSALPYEAAPAVPEAGIYGTQPAAAPAVPEAGIYGTQPAAAPAVPEAGIYGTQPAAAPAVPEAGIYGTRPAAAPAVPEAGIYGTRPAGGGQPVQAHFNGLGGGSGVVGGENTQHVAAHLGSAPAGSSFMDQPEDPSFSLLQAADPSAGGPIFESELLNLTSVKPGAGALSSAGSTGIMDKIRREETHKAIESGFVFESPNLRKEETNIKTGVSVNAGGALSNIGDMSFDYGDPDDSNMFRSKFKYKIGAGGDEQRKHLAEQRAIRAALNAQNAAAQGQQLAAPQYNQSSSASAGLYGEAAPAQAPATGYYGSAPAAAPSPSPLYGSAPAAAPSPSPLYGSAPAAPAPSPLYGSAPAAPAYEEAQPQYQPTSYEQQIQQPGNVSHPKSVVDFAQGYASAESFGTAAASPIYSGQVPPTSNVTMSNGLSHDAASLNRGNPMLSGGGQQ